MSKEFNSSYNSSSGEVEYYKLPKDKQWLSDGNSPYQLGGRNTDIHQLYFSLVNEIKMLYPPNCIPESIVEKLEILRQVSLRCEALIQGIIADVSIDVAGE